MPRGINRLRNYPESQCFVKELDEVEDFARAEKNPRSYIVIDRTLKGERKCGPEQVQGCYISAASREAALPARSWTQG
jgi:hypothetical protein